MLIQDAMDIADVPLEEGIRFFKTSKKMKRLSNVIIQKAQFIEEEDKRRQIMILAGKIIKLADKFDALEQMFKARKMIGKSSKEIKQQYKTLETEYADIVKMANQEQTKVILKNISMYGVMVATMIVPTLIISKLAKEYGVVNPVTQSKELNPFLRAGVYMGSAAAIRAVSPAGKVENINKDVVNKTAQSLQNKEIL